MNTCEVQVQKIKDQFVQVQGAEKFKVFKDSLPEGSLIDVSFERTGEERSYEQIKKIHKLFRIIAEYTGHTVEEIKLYIKYKSGYAYETEVDGIKMIAPLKSIGKMNKKDLSELIEFTINYASHELNLLVE